MRISTVKPYRLTNFPTTAGRMKIGAKPSSCSQSVSNPTTIKKKAHAIRYGPGTLLIPEKMMSGFSPVMLSARETVRSAIGTQNNPSNNTITPTAGEMKIMAAIPGQIETSQIAQHRPAGTTTSSQKPDISGQPGGLSSPLDDATMTF